MTPEELLDKLAEIQKLKCKTERYEYKAAAQGCPKRLYDTLSSFSNLDGGGVIFFGIDEENGYAECGVYDPQDLQRKIGEQCLQMEPKVRPILTVAEKDGKFFVAAEIPPVDLADRPCFYAGSGRIKGSYVRVGDRDEPMTEFEVYSFEAFRVRRRDELRPVPDFAPSQLDQAALKDYAERLKAGKPHFAALDDQSVYAFMNVFVNGQTPLVTVLLFSPYPQAVFPQLCVTAVVVPGTSVGETAENGARFLDNQRIEGNIEAMLNGSLSFIRRNMRVQTVVDPQTGRREDREDYPLTAVREAVLNALAHRDYSVYTEGMPVQIVMFDDRIEIRSPGGLYGRIRVEQLGRVQPDTRNPTLINAMEILGLTENRYSGIPVMRAALEKAHMPEPEFTDRHGTFTVTFRKAGEEAESEPGTRRNAALREKDLLAFCATPRSRAEICDHLGMKSSAYAMKHYVVPLLQKGLLRMTLPDMPRSARQRFVSTAEPRR